MQWQLKPCDKTVDLNVKVDGTNQTGGSKKVDFIKTRLIVSTLAKPDRKGCDGKKNKKTQQKLKCTHVHVDKNKRAVDAEEAASPGQSPADSWRGR